MNSRKMWFLVLPFPMTRTVSRALSISRAQGWLGPLMRHTRVAYSGSYHFDRFTPATSFARRWWGAYLQVLMLPY